MMEKRSKLVAHTTWFEHFDLILAIKHGLVELIPILLIGSFSLAFRYIPIPVYQDIITSLGNGVIAKMFELVNEATFNMLSVYLTISMSYQLALLKKIERSESRVSWVAVSLGGFFILTGIPGQNLDPLGPKGIFVAIVSVYFTTAIFNAVEKRTKIREVLAKGIDVRMGNAFHLAWPMAIVFIVFAVFNHVITRISGFDSFYLILQHGNSMFFTQIGNQIVKAALFVVFSSLFWFMGIHGSNVLEGVSDEVFIPTAQAADGVILNRAFLDNFILLGGCGATICLLFSILLFVKKNNIRNLAKLGIIPAIFNINEIFVFGLPIIYNPYMFIPFIGVPLVCFAITYIAMWTGIVPTACAEVQWTTPVLLSGYMATGSIRGAILQLVNILVGIAIYTPFIRMHEGEEVKNAPKDYEEMLQVLCESEQQGTPICLSEHSTLGLTAKALIADLKIAMERDKLQLFYQPQMNEKGECIGAEALLRWKHELLGYIYPPLIFKLAEEMDKKEELDRLVFQKALTDARKMHEMPHMRGKKISVNVTPNSIQSKLFEEFLVDEALKHHVDEMNICIEITEQAAVSMNDEMSDRLARLCQAGYHLAVDDFSMGSTSIKYLTGNNFSIIKLDGYLVRKVGENSRCTEIVSHIISMAKSLNAEVVAEYVETEEIRDKLLEMGCNLFQGWLFAKAVPMEEYVNNYGNLHDFMIE